MKIADAYIVKSILKTALSALLICTLMVVAVELFSQMNQIVSNTVSMQDLLELSILGIPKYLMMVVSICFLFAVTFFLSQLQANNEMITFYNSGFSYRRIILPIIILAFVVSLFFSFFSETVSIRATLKHDALSEELFGRSSTIDNSNITLSDYEGDFLVHASRFREAEQRIDNVIIIEFEDGRIIQRSSADYALFDNTKGYWTLYNAIIHERVDDKLIPSRVEIYEYPLITLEPRLFRNLSDDISTMERQDAREYLRRMKVLDRDIYQTSATEYIQRLFSPFSILILMLISCSMNYRFKKNVFLFSVIQSLCTAVVYYVAMMVMTIMADQGVIAPASSVLIPVALVGALVFLIRLIGLRNG